MQAPRLARSGSQILGDAWNANANVCTLQKIVLRNVLVVCIPVRVGCDLHCRTLACRVCSIHWGTNLVKIERRQQQCKCNTVAPMREYFSSPDEEITEIAAKSKLLPIASGYKS